MMRLALATIAALALVGCQTNANPTASGSPEITIAGRPEQVKPAIVNAALNRGMKLKGDTAYQATFERPWGNTVGAAVVGALISSDASPAVERMTFSFTEVPAGTRVVLDRYMVKTGSFGREQVSLANGPAPGLEPVQTTLDQISSSLQVARR